MKKICPYCKEEFETGQKGHSRIPCFKKECIEKHQEVRRTYQRNKNKQYRKEKRIQTQLIKSVRLEQKRENEKKNWPYYCQNCGHKLRPPNRINCPKCRQLLSDNEEVESPQEVYGGLSY